ncbi:MAG: sigma-70 family RNA polymerase sigma factor [Paucibacter sp.]|nr:sigma-70 family RNA polymerase sigma factor [Roseateles sp.]
MRRGGNPATGALVESDEVGLLRQVATGDRLAFETLFRAYFPRLTRFLGRFSRSPSLIEEIVNDTMLVVWQKAATFDQSCKVSTWVFAIAYRKALKGMNLSDDPVDADGAEYEDESGHQPEQELGRRQLRRTVLEALDQLPAAQRVVVALTYYHEMAYQDIADIVGCPVNTVKTRMFHARRRLQDTLASEREQSL